MKEMREKNQFVRFHDAIVLARCSHRHNPKEIGRYFSFSVELLMLMKWCLNITHKGLELLQRTLALDYLSGFVYGHKSSSLSKLFRHYISVSFLFREEKAERKGRNLTAVIPAYYLPRTQSSELEPNLFYFEGKLGFSLVSFSQKQ